MRMIDQDSMTTNMTTALDNTLSSTVDRHFLHRGFGAEFEMEVDWIRAHLPTDARRILEIGCGGGVLFDALGTDRVVGLDYAWDGLAHTAARFPAVPLVCASADRVPLRDAFADGIVAQHVLEHLTDGELACWEWFRVLRPGGTLLILTPNVAFSDPRVFFDDTHVHLFSGDELASLLGRVGFEVSDMRTLGLNAFREYKGRPGAWRMRRLVTRWAHALSAMPGLRDRGQTLCCCAVRPDDSSCMF